MKSNILLLCALLMVIFSDCKKQDSLDSIATLDTGTLTLKKGTVTITTPDTTYVFTAPADQIHFAGDSTYYYINCYRDNTTSFSITSLSKPVFNSTSGVSEFHLYGLYQNISQIYNNVSGQPAIGTISIANFNNNGSLVSGSFNADIPKTGNGSQKDAQFYHITGSFDLKGN